MIWYKNYFGGVAGNLFGPGYSLHVNVIVADNTMGNGTQIWGNFGGAFGGGDPSVSISWFYQEIGTIYNQPFPNSMLMIVTTTFAFVDIYDGPAARYSVHRRLTFNGSTWLRTRAQGQVSDVIFEHLNYSDDNIFDANVNYCFVMDINGGCTVNNTQVNPCQWTQ